MVLVTSMAVFSRLGHCGTDIKMKNTLRYKIAICLLRANFGLCRIILRPLSKLRAMLVQLGLKTPRVKLSQYLFVIESISWSAWDLTLESAQNPHLYDKY